VTGGIVVGTVVVGTVVIGWFVIGWFVIGSVVVGAVGAEPGKFVVVADPGEELGPATGVNGEDTPSTVNVTNAARRTLVRAPFQTSSPTFTMRAVRAVFGATSAVLLMNALQRTNPESNAEERSSRPATCLHLQAAPSMTLACTGTEPPPKETTTGFVIIVSAGDRTKRSASAGAKPTRPDSNTASPMTAAQRTARWRFRRNPTADGSRGLDW